MALQIANSESNGTLSISLVGDRTIKKLNKAYMGKNRATDVLSFGVLSSFKTSKKTLGDIIISVDTAKHNAKVAGVTVREELIRLVVHGVLHLLGYDHEAGAGKAASQKMFDLQEKITKKVIWKLSQN